MKDIDRRVRALERGQGGSLSRQAMAWLGWPLTDQEAQIAGRAGELNFAETDTSDWSKGAKTWLGVD